MGQMRIPEQNQNEVNHIVRRARYTCVLLRRTEKTCNLKAEKTLAIPVLRDVLSRECPLVQCDSNP